jgi:hypothetical protein
MEAFPYEAADAGSAAMIHGTRSLLSIATQLWSAGLEAVTATLSIVQAN